MNCPRPFVFCLALVSLILPSFALADTIFSDGTFNLADYTNPFTCTTESGGTISGAVSQCTTCGDLGPALQTVVTVTTASNATTALDIGELNSNFLYDPSTQGALAWIRASVDNSTSIDVAVAEYNLFDPLIKQDGNYYIAQVFSGPGNTGFQPLASRLYASNFEQFDPLTGTVNPAANPNFGGDAMEFGIMIPSGSIALPSFTQTVVYDNLSFDLVPTPDPASWVLMGTALVGLALVRRRRG
jgi:hypothetical protein